MGQNAKEVDGDKEEFEGLPQPEEAYPQQQPSNLAHNQFMQGPPAGMPP